jgi:hypothetical protein
MTPDNLIGKVVNKQDPSNTRNVVRIKTGEVGIIIETRRPENLDLYANIDDLVESLNYAWKYVPGAEC